MSDRVEYKSLQFIKNLKGGYICKSFRKYNVIRNCWYNETKKHWVYYTKYGIHFIPSEYVKIYKH